MKIATADSGCSILDAAYKPTTILSTVALVVDLPYNAPARVEATHLEHELTDPNVLVNELTLCKQLLEQDVDFVHLDLTLGGMNILDITDEYLFEAPMSPMGRSVLHAIMPALRNLATEISETHNIPVLAMGKRSIPVRLAELHATAYGVQHAIEKAHASELPLQVGLPPKVLASFDKPGVVRVTSAEPMESAMVAEVPVKNGVSVQPFLNPVTRGFQVLKISR